ncbi:MAG: DUF2723 domain-containing protein [Chloroflexota bacterium]
MLSAGLRRIPFLVVYGLTMAPDLTWANGSMDGGELITAAVTLGVPHPPGYPTYVAVGKLFSLLPLGTVAFRLNLLSAVATALAGGLLAALIQVHSKRSQLSYSAIAAGLTLGFLPSVWGQATVAEVYGLNLLFVAAFLFCLVGVRSSLTAGIFLGVAITSHLSSLFLVPLALLVAPPREYSRLVIGLCAGLLPLLLVPIFGRLDSPVVWGDPRTVSGWWWVISGQLYSANLQLPASANELLASLTRPGMWPALLLVAGGLLVPAISTRRNDSAQRRETWALGLTVALYGLFALFYQTSDAYVLLLPGLLILVYMVFTTFPIALWLAVTVPVLLVALGFNHQNLHNDTAVRPLAGMVLEAAPENAILLTPGDRTIFTLWYFHHVEGNRPDIMPVDENLLGFDWYRARLQEQYPALLGLEADNLEQFVSLNLLDHPICRAGLAYPSAFSADAGYTYVVGAEDQAPFSILSGNHTVTERNQIPTDYPYGYTPSPEPPAPSGNNIGRLAWLLVLGGLLLLLGWVAFKGVRIYQPSGLMALQSEAESLTTGGLKSIDPQATMDLVTSAHDDIITLNRELTFIEPLTPILGRLPKVGPLTEAAPHLLAMAEAGSEAAELAP